MDLLFGLVCDLCFILFCGDTMTDNKQFADDGEGLTWATLIGASIGGAVVWVLFVCLAWKFIAWVF